MKKIFMFSAFSFLLACSVLQKDKEEFKKIAHDISDEVIEEAANPKPVPELKS